MMKDNNYNKYNRILNILIIVLLISIFAVLAYNVKNNYIENFDNSFYDLITKIASDKLTMFFKIVTHLGDAIFLIAITIILVIFIKERNLKLYVALNLICSFLINASCKLIFARQRPVGINLILEDGYSFPSGHAMVATAFYGYLIYLIFTKIKNRKVKYPLIILLALIILTVAVSRVYLGVHFASDILAGMILASVYLCFFILITDKKRFKQD